MKFRTDFVTNSSSSSFIFQRKFAIEEIRRLRAKLASKARTDPYFTYKGLNDEFDDLLDGIKTIDNFIPEILEDVFSWYRYEIISKFKDNSSPDESEPHKLSDEKLRILAGIWYFDYVGERDYTSPTYELLEEYVWDNLPFAHQYGEELLAILITENVERFQTALANVAKMSLPEIFEMLTGGKYLVYDDFETHYLIEEVFCEDKNCLFGCNHMG